MDPPETEEVERKGGSDPEGNTNEVERNECVDLGGMNELVNAVDHGQIQRERFEFKEAPTLPPTISQVQVPNSTLPPTISQVQVPNSTLPPTISQLQVPNSTLPPTISQLQVPNSNAFTSPSSTNYLQELALDEEAGESSRQNELTSLAFLFDCFKRRWVSVCSCVALILAITLVVGFTVGDTTAIPMDGARTKDNDDVAHVGEGQSSWPSRLNHRVNFPPFLPSSPWPTNTREARLAGWKKSDEECIPELGNAWLYQGTISPIHSVALYFSPQVGEISGHLTGMKVDYYGRIPEGLVGSYFSLEEGLSSEGSKYHSVTVGFRDSNQTNLCDRIKPLPASSDKYIVIAPKMAHLEVPTLETSSKLIEEWQEGSCIQGMGYHWFKNSIANNVKLTYKINTVVPVVPMYHPETGDISGLFFWAPQRMQIWDEKLCTPAVQNMDAEILFECLSDQNFWDPGPGLSQENDSPRFMCANTCDRNCYFEDSFDGTIQTMHFFFYDPNSLICPPGPPGNEDKHCRNGFEFNGWLR